MLICFPVDAKGERFVSFTGLDADSDDYESEAAVEDANEDYDSEADEDFEPGSSGDTGSTTDSEEDSITAVVSGDEEVKAGTAL